ncbi:hypothetical protein THRCLA_02359 [Thraustotheca clavata]|uniref:N-acetyltransferase domain-containing protein n=1 Tax=Thraustotheca clavata TaxID=74557 RepID=A0A1W0A5G6_9STRA|nr:hypothetical protein THRCLA_02359 [Thraustotheca clavata]
MNITWYCKEFNQLSADTLYAILRARGDVFIVELNCPWLDLDNRDQKCVHLIGMKDNHTVAAYARLIPPGVLDPSCQVPVISRVLTTTQFRRKGLGRQMMVFAMKECNRRWPRQSIIVNAKPYLEAFYNSLGFTQTSEPYEDEDGFILIDMIQTP